MPHPRFQTTLVDSILESEDPAGLALESPVDLVSYQVGGRTFVYQANRVSDDIGIFEVFSDGTIAQAAANQATSNTEASFALSLVTVGGATYLYDFGANLDIFRIEDTGLLTLVQSNLEPDVLSNSQSPADFIEIDGTTYLVGHSVIGQIVTHIVNPDGTLGVQSENLTIDAAGLGLSNPFISDIATATVGDQAFAYVQTFAGAIVAYDMAADGTLANERNVAPSTEFPSGGFEVVAIGATQYILSHDINGPFQTHLVAADGSLTLADSIAFDEVFENGLFGTPFETVKTDDGRVLFAVTNNNGNYTVVEVKADGQLEVIEQIVGGNETIDTDWVTTTSFLIDGTMFTVVGSTKVDGLGVYKTTTGPDLVSNPVTTGFENPFVVPGGTITLFIDLENQGDLLAPETDVYIYLSEDQSLGLEDTLLYNFTSFSLLPGESDDANWLLTLPGDLTPGVYYVAVQADAFNTIEENDDTNNIDFVPFFVSYFTDQSDNVTLTTSGTHRMFAGDDYAIGTNDADVLYGEDGGDTIYGKNGNDRIYGGDDTDTLNGGNDNDRIYGDAAFDRLYGRAGRDTIYGGDDPDKVFGGSENDLLFGNKGNDRIYGEGGNDKLNGGDDRDLMFGGDGRDWVTGGDGGDTLFGGANADLFIWREATEAGITGNTRDVIRDFQRGLDDIYLRSLDADPDRGGNQALDFVGTSRFSGDAAEVRLVGVSNGVLVQIDSDGDGARDMEILVTGVRGLNADDFIL